MSVQYPRVSVRVALFVSAFGAFSLSGFETARGAEVPRAAAMAPALPVYDLAISDEAWEKLRRAPRSEERHPARFTANDVEYSAEVRYRGDWARTWPKKPLKIFLEKGTELEGQRILNLNSNWRDPAFVREQLAYHIQSACGVITPTARMVKLNVNGDFLGVYLQVEQPDKAFLRRVGLKGSVIYKCNSNRWKSDESDLGAEALFRAHYEKETHKEEDYKDLQSFCHELATTADIPGFFQTHVDVDRYVNFLAANILIQNWDWFTKNHLLVYDVTGSKKWLPLPWDLDRTLGDHWGGSFNVANVPIQLGTQAQPGNIGWNKLFNAFYNEPALRKRLLNRIEVLLYTEFTEKKLFPVLDRWESEISADVAKDREHWPNAAATDLHTGIAEVKQFITDRRAYLLTNVKAQQEGKTIPARPLPQRAPGGTRRLPSIIAE